MIFHKSAAIQFWMRLAVALTISLTWAFYHQSQLIQSANATLDSIPALSRGVGISDWLFAPPGLNFSKAYLDQAITEKDFKRFKDWGLTHVRLPIEPGFIQSKAARSELISDHIAYVDRAIEWSKKYNLAIVLDVHPLNPFDLKAGTRSPDYDRLQQLWIALAQRYRSQPDTVFYELLNEPGVDEVSTWENIAQTLVNRIRVIDPHHTIVVSGNDGGGRDLERMMPLKGERLVYTFHFYEPMQFTHQSAAWAGDLAKLRDIPYPYDAKRFAVARTRSSSDPKVVHLLDLYAKKRYNKQQIEAEFRPAQRFGLYHHVPLYCGEFGVNRDAPPRDRAAWYRDVVDVLQRSHFGYAFWEYRGGLGLVSPDSMQIEPEMRQAIGFRRS